jgi:hypothetical protein
VSTPTLDRISQAVRLVIQEREVFITET